MEIDIFKAIGEYKLNLTEKEVLEAYGKPSNIRKEGLVNIYYYRSADIQLEVGRSKRVVSIGVTANIDITYNNFNFENKDYNTIKEFFFQYSNEVYEEMASLIAMDLGIGVFFIEDENGIKTVEQVGVFVAGHYNGYLQYYKRIK